MFGAAARQWWAPGRGRAGTVCAMGDLAPRSGGPPSRRAREQRAYRLAVTGGVAAAVTVVGAVLAVVGVIGWSVPLLAAIVTVVSLLVFRRTVSA